MNCHKILWMRQRLKSKPGVKCVRISRGQQKTPQSLQLRMRYDGAHEHLRDAAPTVLRHHKNIRHIGEGGKIRNHSGEADLLSIEERAKA